MECCSNKKKEIPRSEDSKKKIINRLNRVSGQMNGIKKMIEEDRYCEEILIQLSAIEKAIKSLAYEILDEHVHSCIKTNLEKGNYDVLDEFVDLFRRFQ